MTARLVPFPPQRSLGHSSPAAGGRAAPVVEIDAWHRRQAESLRLSAETEAEARRAATTLFGEALCLRRSERAGVRPPTRGA
jgi:hypothetical protein